MKNNKNKLLIFIVAYNAEKTILSVLQRIPLALADNFLIEVLIIDDCSKDATYNVASLGVQSLNLPFPIILLRNPINQGYGGNQKIGYHYAIKHNFDYVALIHGDGQYAPECLPDLMKSFDDGADAVFGSRMMTRGQALEGGMPMYKYIGNKILTQFENWMLNSSLSEFHSGYRIYAVNALQKVPFDLNTNDFHFDTEIIVQFVARGLIIVENPIPTFYGDEVCHVNGMKYAFDVTATAAKYRVQRLGIFYDRRFDLSPESIERYQLKLLGVSSHTMTMDSIKKASKIFLIGDAVPKFPVVLQNYGYKVCVANNFQDKLQQAPNLFKEIIESDPDLQVFNQETFDYVLLLDEIEHLDSPEVFVENLRRLMYRSIDTRVIVTTANIGFIANRLMLLFGEFNYGKHGILDLSHKRLFTFKSLRRMFEQSGYEVIRTRGIPVPFNLVIRNHFLASMMTGLNEILIKISKGLFSYQIFMEVQPKPSLELLLENANLKSK